MKSTFAPQTDREIATPRPPRKGRYFESTPFRGLDFFDFEHAAIFHGRTKAVGEVLDALKQQAKGAQRFVLVLGPSGSGKSSLVRAGVLPVLTEVAAIERSGPWRRAVTRPGAGGAGWDPLDGLAATLLDQSALPELRISASPQECRNLATVLRTHPEGAALRVKHALDRLSRSEFEPRLDEQESELPLPWKGEDAELAGKQSLGEIKPQAQFALVVDQLEELFTSGFPFELQQRYLAALSALAGCERVFVIATLQSDFFARYQQSVGTINFPASLSTCELDQPTPREIGKMIRLPVEAAGLRFERDPKTGRSLDEILVEATAGSAEPLPLLEHLLLQLYHKQRERKDGFLRWSDYYELGELEGALAHHAESVFSMLKAEEQAALGCVMGHLVTLDSGQEDVVNPRTVPYRDLVSCPGLENGQPEGAKGLVDRLIEEGLLRAETGPTQEVVVNVAHEALLRGWPRVWQWFSESQEFLRMRDRLDANLKLWLSRGCQTEDLLDPRTSRAEAKKLAKDFGSSLTETEFDYIRESLAYQNRRWGVRRAIGLAVLGALAVLATLAALIWPDTQILRNATKAYAKLQHGIAHLAPDAHEAAEVQPKSPEQQDAALVAKKAELAANQRDALQAQLKDTEAQAQTAQKNTELAASQRDALQAQLKDTQATAQQVQKNAELAASQRDALQTQLKDIEAKAQTAQKNAETAASQRDALQTELKDTQAKAQQAQQNADTAASQRETLQAQLKDTEAKAQQAQQSAELAANQRDALQAQLKDTEAKAQTARKDAEVATTPGGVLQTQLRDAEAKAQQAQRNADVAASQRDVLQAQLKDSLATAQQAQKDAGLAASQRDTLQAQLKDTQATAQQAQKNAEHATTQRDALQAQLKETEAKAQQAQKNAEHATTERDALQTQLKDTETEAQQAQKNAEHATTQRGTLQAQLNDTEAKMQQVQKNAGLATTQRDALQTQLKDTEAKAQQAQKDAEVAKTERDALQTQLKDTEAKMQQVQKNADVAANQREALQAQLVDTEAKAQQAQKDAEVAKTERDALQTQLKDTEAKMQQVQKNADAAASQREALQARLMDTEAKAQTAQKNTELVTSQPDTLQAQLKDTEAKAQAAQKNVELAASQRDALQNQLNDAEDKAQTAQKNTGLVASQRDALENQLKSAEGKPEQAGQGANPTPKNEPLTGARESVNLASINQNQAAVSPPTPSIAAPANAGAVAAQTDKKGSAEEQSLKQFVREYIRSVASNDLSAQERFFEHRVNYYGEGLLSREQVRASLVRYEREWQVRNWEPRGEPELPHVLHSKNPRLYEVIQPFTWTISNGAKHEEGSGTLYVRLWKNDKGEFHIIYVRHNDTDLASIRSKSGETQPSNVQSKVATAASTLLFDSSAQRNEPAPPGQKSGRLAPVDQSQAAVAVPTPSVSPSAESISPEPQTNKNAEAPEDVTSLKGFVRDYIRTVERDDVSAQERFFAPQVNFYGEGVLSLPKVQAVTEHYHREWPNRKWEPRGNPKVVPSAEPDQYEILQPFTWSVSNGIRHAEGSATLYVRVSKDGKGEFHIVHVAQQQSGPAESRSSAKEFQPPHSGQNAESRVRQPH